MHPTMSLSSYLKLLVSIIMFFSFNSYYAVHDFFCSDSRLSRIPKELLLQVSTSLAERDMAKQNILQQCISQTTANIVSLL